MKYRVSLTLDVPDGQIGIALQALLDAAKGIDFKVGNVKLEELGESTIAIPESLEFVQWIKAMMKAYRVSVRDIATHIGLSDGTVQNFIYRSAPIRDIHRNNIKEYFEQLKEEAENKNKDNN